jgi:hypothetical protein
MASSVLVSISRQLEDGVTVEYNEVSNAAAGVMSADGDEGKWILFSLAILMSWCFLIVAAAMGYYSWKEDRLLLRYLREGVVIPGQVSNIVLLREGSSNSSYAKKKVKKTKMASGEENADDGTASLSYSDEKHESVRSDVPYAKSSTYLAAIKYNVELAPGYSTGILKWARLQGDVLPRSLFNREKSSMIGMTVLFNSKFSLNISKNDTLLTPTQQERSRSDSDTSLPLLLIKAFPLGAHPRSAIIKARSISSRLVSTSIVAFFATFGAVTHFLAIHSVYAEDITTSFSEHFAKILPTASLSLLCIIAFLMFMVVRFLDKPIDAMLRGEYTERGEYATKAGDDYTLNTLEMACRTFSTRSDAFLTSPKYHRQLDTDVGQ